MRVFCLFLFLVLSGLKLIPRSVSVSLFDLFALIFISYFWMNNKLRIVWPKKISTLVLGILCIQLISVIFYQPTITKFIFAIRFVEYFLILFVASFYFLRREDIYKPLLAYYYLIVLLFFMPIIPLYRHGLFNYAWEAPAIVSILAFYFLLTPGSRIVKVSTIICALVLIYLSGQRTPAVAFIITLAIYFWNTSSHWRKPFLVIISTTTLLVAGTYADTRLFTTFYDVINPSNISAMFELMSQVDVISSDYDTFVDVDGSRSLVEGGDISLQLRLRKWIYALASQLDSPHTFLVGLGTGFFGGAADSSLMRVYFETGVIGLLVWSLFFRQAFRFQSSVISYVTICFLLNGVFIDVLYSSRIFPLYLLILGSYLGSRKIIFHAR
jgi:hypothetical protein